MFARRRECAEGLVTPIDAITKDATGGAGMEEQLRGPVNNHNDLAITAPLSERNIME
ncbi:hypothetical protein SKA58_07690 [Sphingomonas sp. SKA58]|nr:hypothetical protein SKA58_07690 [Sphingomonas sp. SKA58]